MIVSYKISDNGSILAVTYSRGIIAKLLGFTPDIEIYIFIDDEWINADSPGEELPKPIKNILKRENLL